MAKRPLSAEEIETLIGARDHAPFLNARNEEYRRRGLAERPPARAEAVALMAANPNLIRRPLLLADGEVVFGFDEARYRRLARGA
jgi:arsenate reductase